MKWTKRTKRDKKKSLKEQLNSITEKLENYNKIQRYNKLINICK